MDLHSSFRKLIRAREHVYEFQESIRTWRESGFYEITRHDNFGQAHDPHVGVLWRIKVINEPPADWGIVVGDVVTNLRAALDHAITAVVVEAHPDIDDAILRLVQFPIEDSRPKFKARIRPFKELLDAGAIETLESVQPYRDKGPHPLVMVRELSNRDKHRALVVTPVTAMAFAFESDIPGLDVRAKAGEPIVDGKVLAIARFPRNRSNQDFDLKSRLEWIEHIDTATDAGAVPAALLVESLYQETFDACASMLAPIATDDDVFVVRTELSARDQRAAHLKDILGDSLNL